MCGIVGIVDFKDRPVDPADIAKMNDTIVHRGPDDSGQWMDGPVGLAMRRLSIIDLSGGHQPMFNETGSVVTVFNGEIYNYPELRERLIARGHVFKTHSDTEVIPHLYEDKAEDLVADLTGMFAIAVWDREARQLVLARDRLGEKPLYYLWHDGRLVFASELKAIRALGLCGAVSAEAVRYYMNYGYVPAPLSIYENVRKLPPAHLLIARDGRMRTQRYWDVTFDPREDLQEPEALDELREVLGRSVKRQLISDVPLGAFLSGGVDSSTIVALMCEMAGGRVRTFSIAFDEASHNEAPYAEAVARRFGTKHTVHTVRPNIRETIDPILNQFDEPFADSSAIPTYFLCKTARQHVTVALSGDGGDEVFTGYDRYRAFLRKRPLYRIPRPIRRLVCGSVSGLMPLGTRGKRFLRSLTLDPLTDYVSGSGELTLESLLTEDYRGVCPQRSVLGLADEAFRHGRTSELDAICLHDLRLYLPDDILVKVDRMSMAVSLEVRVPILDHHVVEWGGRLPARLRVNGGTLKYLLKKLLERYMPPEHVHRDKMGFGVPLDRWFRCELKDLVEDRLCDSEIRRVGVLRPSAVRYLLRRHQSGSRNFESLLWRIFVIQTWMVNHA